MLVFGIHMRYIKRTVNAMTLSLRTREMLNDVLGRFTNFCVNYAILMISSFMLMVLAIVDIAGAWSSRCDEVFLTAYYLYASARFFCFLRAVYILSYVYNKREHRVKTHLCEAIWREAMKRVTIILCS